MGRPLKEIQHKMKSILFSLSQITSNNNSACKLIANNYKLSFFLLLLYLWFYLERSIQDIWWYFLCLIRLLSSYIYRHFSRRNFPLRCPHLHLFGCDGELKLERERQRLTSEWVREQTSKYKPFLHYLLPVLWRISLFQQAVL